MIKSLNNVELMEVLNNRKCEFMNNDKSRFRRDNHIYFLISLPEKKDVDNFQRLRLKTTFIISFWNLITLRLTGDFLSLVFEIYVLENTT